jgi:hypothetical protein
VHATDLPFVGRQVAGDRQRALLVVEDRDFTDVDAIGLEMLPVEIRVSPKQRGNAEHAERAESLSKTGSANSASSAFPLRDMTAADRAWTEMIANGATFWTAVHAPFMDRELTKSDVRDLIKRGLQQTQGSYRKLVEVFHLKASDYKRLLAFLYQHDCHLPFHPFREGKDANRVNE